MFRCKVVEWYKKFQVLNNQTAEIIAHIDKIMKNNRWISIHQISDKVNISYGTTQEIIIKDVGFHKLAGR